MTDHDDESRATRAFESLRESVTVRTRALPLSEIAGRARHRRLHQLLAIGAAPVCVLAVGVGIWVSHGTSPSTSPLPVAPKPGSASPSAGAPDGSSTPSPRNGNGSAATVDLPADYLFNTLATDDGGRLQVVGTDAAGQSCAAAAVSTEPFGVSTARTFNCPNPDDALAEVSPVVTYLKDSNDATVSIAVTSATRGVTATGPPVMTFEHASDTNPMFAYGGDSLWIYDAAATQGSRAIQVSLATGQVESSTATPQLYHPILAADAKGLWIGNSIRGAEGPTLLHIANGSHIVTTVMAQTNTAVDWLDTDGAHVWAGVRDRDGTDETLWRFDSSTMRPLSHVPEPGLLASDVVGGQDDGLWTALPYPSVVNGVRAGTNTELDVIRIDPDTGERTVEAVLPPLDQLSAEQGIRVGSAAYHDGAYYLLLPPIRQGGYLGYSTLTRVTADD